MTPVVHGLQVGEQVRLDFLNLLVPPPCLLPADGFFTVTSVLNSAQFTITHPSSNQTCGSLLSPAGNVDLPRTVQTADLNYSLPCLPAYQIEDLDVQHPQVLVETLIVALSESESRDFSVALQKIGASDGRRLHGTSPL